MGKEKKEQFATYKPLKDKSRFWMHSEDCYTEDDLRFREWVLQVRANSGIHPDYLANPSSWFAENSQALINVYDHAWFFSDAFKTRHVLSRDDFHVQPVDSHRLQWPAFYDLMQKVGDYLLTRNKDLQEKHLNQPMNFVFLDVNNILKGLSQNPNIQQVQEQLELLNQYLRTIEISISPLIGSDRLFLANFRSVVESNIQPHLTHLFETQLLRERLGELSKTIKKLSTDRNRILHFALNINQVNPHPYDYSIGQIEDSAAYPTQAAKNCGKESTELIANPDPVPVFHLTMEQLKACPNFKLISMDEDILSHYAGAISDLNELERFQNVITQTMDLLGQAGEVYTIHQFKDQMVSLLTQIGSFIDDSSIHIDAIIRADTHAYHKAIQDGQDLSLLRKIFTSEKEKLQSYIKNHDTLTRFPSSHADLLKTNKALKGQVGEVISHLSQPRLIETSFEAIAGQAQELDKLMGSMHKWITIQYTKKGLIAPEVPKPLKIASVASDSPVKSMHIDNPISHHPPLFTPTSSTLTQQICPVDGEQCETINSPSSVSSSNSMAYLGLIVLIPIGIIALYVLLYGWPYKQPEEKKRKESSKVYGTKDDFNKLKISIEDLFTKIKEFENRNDIDLGDEYDLYVEKFNRILKKADSGEGFNTLGLKRVLDDLQYFQREMCSCEMEQEPESSANCRHDF